MIASLISALILGTARAADGADKINRQTYVFICVAVVGFLCALDAETRLFPLYIIDAAAWMWVLCVLTMLPPHALFSAIHGQAVGRRDGRWQFLQRWSLKLVRKLDLQETQPDCIVWRVNWYHFAMVYGAIRALLIIPAAIWLNEPWLMLAMLQGVLMWVCGKVWPERAVMLHWFIVGAFIGGMM